MRITLTHTAVGGKSVSWDRVKMPFSVPLTRDGTGKHQDLRRDFWTVESWAFKNRVGVAFRVRHRKGRTVYWTWRKPLGLWSADARRKVVGTHPELTLVCFVDVDYLGLGLL